MLKNMIIAAFAGGIGLAGMVGCASDAEYQQVSIPQGGSRQTTALVRTDKQEASQAPYALTGQPETKRAENYRAVQQPTGTHPTSPSLAPVEK